MFGIVQSIGRWADSERPSKINLKKEKLEELAETCFEGKRRKGRTMVDPRPNRPTPTNTFERPRTHDGNLLRADCPVPPGQKKRPAGIAVGLRGHALAPPDSSPFFPRKVRPSSSRTMGYHRHTISSRLKKGSGGKGGKKGVARALQSFYVLFVALRHGTVE
jgi:hypothetical protein